MSMPLDLLILRALREGARHGYAIARWIKDASGEALHIEEGSLYPALHRLEQSGSLKAEWKKTETGRKAKFYRLTAAGKRVLREETSERRAFAKAVNEVIS